MRTIKTFFMNDEGASGVEYGILIAFIAAVIIVTVASLGIKLNTKFIGVDSNL